ncbi:MAG: hypothetical protein QM594_09505 [Niabella sp.]
MVNNTSDSLLTVCKLLQKHQVLYLLVGGTAVALNGYFRLSINDSGELTEKPDIDVWYNPTYQNYFKLIKVIEELVTMFLNIKVKKAQIHVLHFLN